MAMARPVPVAAQRPTQWAARRGAEQWRPSRKEPGMYVWTVQLAAGEEDRVEAPLVATEGGALVALSEDGHLVQAWAPGHWRTVRRVTGVEAHPAGKANGNLVQLPRG